MSVKVMGMVWDLELERDEKFILLAYADHADHYGGSIYPAVATIAKKTGYSERSVQLITRQLESKNILIPDGSGPQGTRRWRIAISGGEISSPRGEKSSPGGEIYAPGGESQFTGGVNPSSPEPSFNHQLTVLYSETDFQNMTVKEAYQIQELRIFRDATGKFPPAIMWHTVWSDLHEHGWTIDQIRSAYKEWVKRGYNKDSLAWMEWIGMKEYPTKFGKKEVGSFNLVPDPNQSKAQSAAKWDKKKFTPPPPDFKKKIKSLQERMEVQ